jgi:hypothetical protein
MDGQVRCIELWWGDVRERGYLKDLRVDGRVILKWIFEKWDGEAWTSSGAV